jgi:hypothetical protein
MNREKLESYLEKNPFSKLSEVVTQILYDEIVILDIPPASKLNVNQIASDLGISRTPVWKPSTGCKRSALSKPARNRAGFM